MSVEDDILGLDEHDESKIRARKLELDELRSIMRDESGRRFMYRWLRTTGYFADGFDRDPCVNARMSGARSVGVLLVNEMMQADIDLYNLMIKEANHD